MASARGVFREQHVAWAQLERLALACLEAERAAEREDQLTDGAVCHSKTPPDDVSWNEMVATASWPLRRSPRAPDSRSRWPSSTCEF